MSKRDETKAAIASKFIELVESNPIEKVTVAMLVEAMSVNRKTFYYHFRDKPDLIIWIFRHALATRLIEGFEADQLLYPASSQNEVYTDIPCYVRVKLGIRSLDQSQFFKVLCEVFGEHRAYYSKVFGEAGGGFGKYLQALYLPAFESDVQFILGGRYLPRESVRFLATYFATAVFGTIRQSLPKTSGAGTMQEVEPFLNLTHECLRHAIEDHPARRSALR